MTLIAVALRADAGEVCQDHIQMFDYGYNNFEKIQVPGGSVVVPKGTDVSSLKVVDTETEGKTEQLYYYQNDVYVGEGVKTEQVEEESPLVITPEIAEEDPAVSPTQEAAQSVEGNNTVMKDVFRKLIGILLGMIVVVLVITVYSSGKKKKRKRRRRQEKRK